MFIEFRDIELLSFFESEPVYIGDYEECNWIYSITKDGFELVLAVETYEKNVNVTLSYNESIIYSQKFKNVNKIQEIDAEELILYLKDGQRVILKKNIQLGVIVE